MSEIKTWEEMESSGEYDDYGDMAREFARKHVIEALKEVLNNTENWDDCKVIPVEKVLNAYPLENIK